jgi:hypothetical protein
MIAAAIGQDADVPWNLSVHPPDVSVVTLNKLLIILYTFKHILKNMQQMYFYGRF